jgi:hypothetical protein
MPIREFASDLLSNISPSQTEPIPRVVGGKQHVLHTGPDAHDILVPVIPFLKGMKNADAYTAIPDGAAVGCQY